VHQHATPYLLDFPGIGDLSIGFVSVAGVDDNVPFDVRRVFWTYGTPEHVVRGRHAHHESEMVLVAVAGKIVVVTELADGTTNRWVLDTPTHGLYLPPQCWRTMTYSPTAVQLAMASTDYHPEDYIRDYDTFHRKSENEAEIR
jgi:hypothetical protein